MDGKTNDSEPPPEVASRQGSAQGDAGYTDLLGRRRVAKHDPQVEALGAIDTVVSTLGVAKRSAHEDRARRFMHQAQQDLYKIMAELAMPPGHPKSILITPEHLAWLDRSLATVQAPFAALNKFVLPGACDASAPIDVARAEVRTAERRLAKLAHDGVLQNAQALAYVNRLSLVLFYLARSEDVVAGVDFDLAAAPSERAEL